jgi:integrase/recombinase XerD
MARSGASRAHRDALLTELENIGDTYRLDVRQFIGFLREKKLSLAEGFIQFARWLEEDHEGRRYSPATFNRKMAAARSRMRYAFQHSAHAGRLRKKYNLQEILGAVKLKKIDIMPVASDKILDIEEARKLVGQTRDATIRLMVTFLVSTGVRVSEMLGLHLSDLKAPKGELVQVHVVGKGGRERTIHVKKAFLDRIEKHFHGKNSLFEHHGKPYSRISVTNRIKRESLGVLGREVTPQQLRHSWAAIQIKRGRDLGAVAAVLGRSSAGLTARLYARSTLKPEEAFLDLEGKHRSDMMRMDDDGGRVS